MKIVLIWTSFVIASGFLAGCEGGFSTTGDDSGVVDVTGDEPADMDMGPEQTDSMDPSDSDAPDFVDVPADEPVEACDGHCTNGMQDCGEDGIDCGGGCPACGSLSLRGNWLGINGSDGTWRVAIPTGQLVIEPADVLDRMAASGKNIIRIGLGAGGWGVNTLSLYRNSNFNDGLDQNELDRIEAFLSGALDRDIGVLLGLWGTVALECERPAGWEDDPRRWDANPWNALVGRGGPYLIDDTEICGKRNFITFHSYGEFLYNPGDTYPDAADMNTKGQWRQEEIIYNLAVIARNYPNTGFHLMWEADDYSTHQCGQCNTDFETMDSWHAHMAALIKSLGAGIMVTTGHIRKDTVFTDLDFISFTFGDAGPDRFCGHGPAVTTGWGHSELETCCDSCNPAPVLEIIRNGWLCGIQIGSPFWEYKPYNCHSDFIDPACSTLRDFFDNNVDTWEDEPGIEITDAELPPL